MLRVHVNNISHGYGALSVLKNISFQIEEGAFTSIVGPSGCGKTTLLKIIGGLISPSQGSVGIEANSFEIAFGQEIRKQRVGFVFQNPALLPWRTVVENIRLPLEIIKRRMPFMSMEKLVAIVGLKGFENFYPFALSGGMKHRVAVARALIFNPYVLLLDEPLAALDEPMRESLNLELLRIWRQTQKTIVLVTHSISEAVFLSQRVIVLSKRPAEIMGACDIDLPYPRMNEMKESKNYLEHVSWIRKQLENS